MSAFVYATLAVFLLATPAGAVVLKSKAESYPAEGVERVRIDFPGGSLQIEASDETEVEVTVFVKCKRWSTAKCQRRADRVELKSRRSGDRLTIQVEGIPKFMWLQGPSKRIGSSHIGGVNVECHVKLPRSLDLRVEMGVGELVVRDLDGDLDLDLGLGEVDVEVPESTVGEVRLNVGIAGDASLSWPDGHRSVSGLFGRKLRWGDGDGPSRVEVNLGVGDAHVTLM